MNVVFAVWGWLGYSYTQNVESLGGAEVTAGAENMPGTKLVLLREQAATANVAAQPASAEAVVSVSPQPHVAEHPSIEAQLCTLLGPVMKPEDAKALLSRLNALQIQAKYVALQVDGSPDYWVYLRPEPTKDLAIEKLRELQGKQIDSFLIPQGDLANGISLGIFDSQENAEKHRQTITQLGYDAQLKVNPRGYLENWIAIYPDQVAGFSQELYNQLRTENSKLDLRKDECRKVASTIDIQ
ncbi:MAG: hypothetical protein R3E67_03230 [Pseudomonadales bacterium]